jgi:hypothetical protein
MTDAMTYQNMDTLNGLSYWRVLSVPKINSFFTFLGWGETWYVGHEFAYCTSPGWETINVEQSVEWELAGEVEIFEENLPQYHFVHHKISHDPN